MEDNIKKCSLSKHSQIDASSYCQNCKLNLCNKCRNFHDEIHEGHNLFNLNKDLKEIFVDLCNKEDHNKKLEFYCKNHNTLCCAVCLCKLKNEKYGQHSDCNICPIKDIKDEKKNNLNKNIKYLEDISNNFEKSINELKKIMNSINESKEQLKIKIQKAFTNIRNAINEREDKLLLEVDEKYDNTFIKDDIIKEGEKLPKIIKILLDKGKMIDKEWNDDNINSLIYDCINIENNIQEITKINNLINKYNSNKEIKIDFKLEEDKINNILNIVKLLGEIIIIKEKELKNDLYNNFDIKNKNPIHVLKNHTRFVWCMIILKDGRLASCSRDSSIIIYNKETYKPDLIIKEHNDAVCCIIQLNSGLLASCSMDKTIKLFNIIGNKYELKQTLNNHNNEVLKIIEFNKEKLISCSYDKSIVFYNQDNNIYKQDYNIQINGICYSIIQTNINEICYSESSIIWFYDINEKKIKASIKNIEKSNNYYRE